jgi:succinate dehydrogenase/fumarate reductase cytochrome b subunit
LAQSGILTGFAIFGMASNYSYPWVLSQVAQFSFMGPALIFLGKFAIAWPVMYHLFNGCRHLVSCNFILFFVLPVKKLALKIRYLQKEFFLPSILSKIL